MTLCTATTCTYLQTAFTTIFCDELNWIWTYGCANKSSDVGVSYIVQLKRNTLEAHHYDKFIMLAGI